MQVRKNSFVAKCNAHNCKSMHKSCRLIATATICFRDRLCVVKALLTLLDKSHEKCYENAIPKHMKR